MEYIITSPLVYRQKALDEINFDSYKELGESYTLGNFNNDEKKVLTDAKNSIFIHNIFPVHISKENLDLCNLEKIIESVEENMIKKSKSFAIETAAYRSDIHTRDLEVKLGESLESIGYKADLENPETIIYSFLQGKNLYLGVVDTDETIYRYLDNSKKFSRVEDRLNRAQYKLVEAFDRFNIDIKDGIAMDIGAAPGGWTKELIDRGFKVYAIDPAKLDNSLKDNKNVVHIKDKIENVDINYKNFDIIVNDMNCNPIRSAEIMVNTSKFLKKGGLAIMTAKLVSKNVDFFIDGVIHTANGVYDIKEIKHLQQNREEITFLFEHK